MPATVIRNKEIVERFYDAGRAGDIDRFDELMVEDYQQLHPLIDNGREAVKAFFRPVGPIETDVHRVIAEGDLVTAHVHYKPLDLAAIDIFGWWGHPAAPAAVGALTHSSPALDIGLDLRG